jgi:hypothetical protein
MARKRHGKASCMRVNSLPCSSQIESSLMIFVFLPSESRNMSCSRVGAFAQRVARTIAQLEVAHGGVYFQNMKVVILFPSSLCLVLRPKNPFVLLLASSIRERQTLCTRALSALRGCRSHLRHNSSLSFMYRSPRTLEFMDAASCTKMSGIRTSIPKPWHTQSMTAPSHIISTLSQHSHKPRISPPSIHDGDAEFA